MTAAQSNRALASLGMKDYQSALHDLNQMIDRGRPSTRILLLRARVHMAMGNAQLADADRLAAWRIEPRDADDWVARGVSLLNDSPEAALADFKSALHIRPNDVKAMNNAAHAYSERLNDPRQAIEMLSRLIAIRPNQASAIASRGILHARVGNWKYAIGDAMFASKLAPSAREQLQIAGIHAMLIDAQRFPATHREEAITWLARALKTDMQLARVARDDTDLSNIADDPRFVGLIESGMAIEATSQRTDR
jgi:tetratricopeptide (TPR) repeat protein